MSLKTERFLYTARNFTTGLTDVKATLRRAGTVVASGLALAEVSGGEYELVLSPAQLTSFGGAGYYDVYINSATKDAPAVAGRYLLANDADDLRGRTDAVEAKVDTANTGITAVKGLLSDGTSGTAALRTAIDAVASIASGIQNNTRFTANLPGDLIRPTAGSNRYKIPLRLYNDHGTLEDPDNKQILVTAEDESGNDRTSYIVGYTSGPVVATYLSLGRYVVNVDIPSTAEQEQLNFYFNYAENGAPLEQARTTQVLLDVQSAGFAKETTLQDVRTRTVDMQPRVANIESVVTSTAFGNAAIRDRLVRIEGYTDTLESELANPTYGLPAAKAALDTKASQASVNAAQADITAIKGANFDQLRDSLAAISARTLTGGYAV